MSHEQDHRDEPAACCCGHSRRDFLRQSAIAAAATGAASVLSQSGQAAEATAAEGTEETPNAPIGKARGIHPGRVAWAHDPQAVSWEFKGRWWEDGYNDQKAIDTLLSKVVCCVAGKESESLAWDALFKSFNQRKGHAAGGYAPGQKIAVKINMNNTSGHEDAANINASPHLVLSLLRQLVGAAGVPQSKITIFDASRFITNNIFDKCHAEFPEVVFVDNIGGDGRQKSTYVDDAIPFTKKCRLATGLATCAVEADYLINMAILKGHVGTGVTFCGKNYFGATSIDSNWKKNKHDNFNAKAGKPVYLAFTDYMAHKDLGEKTMLFLMDALYGCEMVGGPPKPKWKMAPFNNHWPASLFASEDGIALDSVATDFFCAEFPDGQDIARCDYYLHEGALIEAPPSGTVYDPAHDGKQIASLGVHEHWNNSTERKYTRNLAPSGTGIELVALA